MRKDNRLSRVLHVLLHLDETDAPVTSEMIGRMLGTNPSLVRRTMGGLREAGFVTSTKGHGGGWCLAKPLSDITLSDVYGALGKPSLFAMGTSADTPTCLLEQAANAATQSALKIARDSFLKALSETTVADLVGDSRERIEAYRRSGEGRCQGTSSGQASRRS